MQGCCAIVCMLYAVCLYHTGHCVIPSPQSLCPPAISDLWRSGHLVTWWIVFPGTWSWSSDASRHNYTESTHILHHRPRHGLCQNPNKNSDIQFTQVANSHGYYVSRYPHSVACIFDLFSQIVTGVLSLWSGKVSNDARLFSLADNNLQIRVQILWHVTRDTCSGVNISFCT